MAQKMKQDKVNATKSKDKSATAETNKKGLIYFFVSDTGLGILFSSPIQTEKTAQSCGPTRQLSKTAKVVSIRLLVVEKKIIPHVLLTSDFEGRRKSRSSINRHF